MEAIARLPRHTIVLVVAVLLASIALSACSGRGGDDSTTTGSQTPSGSATAGASESIPMLVAFAPNPDEPGVTAKPVRIADLAGGDNRDIGQPGQFSEVAFSPDGSRLATAATDGTVDIYQVSDGSLLTSNNGPGVTDLDWAPEGSTLAVVRAASVTFIDEANAATVHDDFGAAKDANPLTWAWTPDGSIFALINDAELVLQPVSAAEDQVRVPKSGFPAQAESWAVRTGEEGREIGVDDLAPVSGLPEGRAEYPIILQPDGSIEGGEFRYVSIYDWNNLPTPEFDYATTLQFPAVRKTCDPCRSADGASSLLVIWSSGDGPTPTPEVTNWPESTHTILAIEGDGGSATAIDLGITPDGAIDIASWAPVYDAVRVSG